MPDRNPVDRPVDSADNLIAIAPESNPHDGDDKIGDAISLHLGVRNVIVPPTVDNSPSGR